MHPRLVLLGAGLAVLAVTRAEACPDRSATTAVGSAPQHVTASTLLAWKPRPWSPAPGRTVAAQGLRVAIDPVDGAIGMPAADELQQLVFSGDDTPLAVTRRADGSIRAALDERFADYAVVRVGADGKPRWTCVHGSAQAAKFVSAPKPQAVPPVLSPAPGTVWEEK
jgi:hypothetical protein